MKTTAKICGPLSIDSFYASKFTEILPMVFPDKPAYHEKFQSHRVFAFSLRIRVC
jgi:hypothetical protein